MASSTNSGGHPRTVISGEFRDLRYAMKYCGCGEKADIRITEKGKNTGKLYYVCHHPQKICGFWEWCYPISSNITEMATPPQHLPLDEGMAGYNNLVEEVDKIKYESGQLASSVRVIEATHEFVKLLARVTLFMSVLAFLVSLFALCKL